MLEPTLFVQGLSLCATSLGLVVMSTVLTLHATTLSNVRYVPGIALMLLIQATLELHFFGPARIRSWSLRRLGIVVGVAAELTLAGALLRRLW